MVFLSILTNVKPLCEKKKKYMNKSDLFGLVSAAHGCQIWVIFLSTYFCLFMQRHVMNEHFV